MNATRINFRRASYNVFSIAASRVAPAFLASLLLLAVMLLAATAKADPYEGKLPQAAAAMGREINRQVEERFGSGMGMTVIMTTPVDVNNFEVSNAVARQMQEELTRCFVRDGYAVQEMRKGKTLLFQPQNGEFLLTRKTKLLGDKTVDSNMIMVGTYTLTAKSMRFNIKLVDMKTEEIYAMSNVTMPLSMELRGLLSGSLGGLAYNFEPSVYTRLP